MMDEKAITHNLEGGQKITNYAAACGPGGLAPTVDDYAIRCCHPPKSLPKGSWEVVLHHSLALKGCNLPKVGLNI
jgi:hypothetical protein